MECSAWWFRCGGTESGGDNEASSWRCRSRASRPGSWLPGAMSSLRRVGKSRYVGQPAGSCTPTKIDDDEIDDDGTTSTYTTDALSGVCRVFT